jgi:hypothetical protein
MPSPLEPASPIITDHGPLAAAGAISEADGLPLLPALLLPVVVLLLLLLSAPALLPSLVFFHVLFPFAFFRVGLLPALLAVPRLPKIPRAHVVHHTVDQ